MKRKKTIRKISLEGIVTPSAWDEDCRITAVKISASGEREFLVTEEEKGRELLALVRQKLKVSGLLHENENGSQTVTIKTYEPVGF